MDEFVMDIKWGQIWGGVVHSYKIANNISSKKEKKSTTNWTIINESLLRRIGNIEIGLHIANSRHDGHVDTLDNSRICYS